MYSSIAALALLATGAASQSAMGFNYGSTFTNNAAKMQSDFEAEFNQAKGLVGAPGFTSARLYTMIQAGTTNSPISAIPAAIATQTRLLLGLWGSAGEAGIQQEIAALSSAISQYGSAFTSLIDGISVGSEDLYRISPTGIENMSGVGAGPDDIANYISQVRNAIANTGASGAPVGHVDTWTAWVNGSNQAVINACDFIGMDAYPYFQNTIANGIDIGQEVFNDALGATRGAVGGKPVWITETGWPVSGPQQNQAVASIPNAQTYWQQVSCEYQGNTNLWWYTLQDALPDTPSPSFGLVGAAGGETPLFDLSCPNGKGASASSSVAPSASAQASSVAAEVSAAATGASAAPTQDSGSPGASGLKGSSAAAAPSGSVSSAHYAPASSSGAAAASGSDKTSAVASGSGSDKTSAAASGSDKTSAAGSGAGVSTAQMTTYETTTLCPVTMTGASGAVSTILSTSTLTVTSCAGGCSHPATASPTAAPSAGSPAGSAPAGSAPGTPQSAPSQAPAAAPSATSTSTSGACPASLSGTYEYPHLMVPVDKDHPTTAKGTSYNGTFSSTVSTIYNFDIPASDAGKTCTLVFLLPNQQDLQTSSYDLSGSGGIDVKGLEAPADQSTSYSTVPAVSGDVGSVASVTPGNSYTISSGSCAAGQRIGYEVSATGSLSLNYFQDYNPSPLGLYITVC